MVTIQSSGICMFFKDKKNHFEKKEHGLILLWQSCSEEHLNDKLLGNNLINGS